MAEGLLDVGLLDRNQVGSAQDVVEKRAYTPYYMHRTGHWLGMDVHDCGSYVEPTEAEQTTERQDPLSGQTVVTRPSRIEDDAIVTAEGCELISRDVPVKADEIEALMRG